MTKLEQAAIGRDVLSREFVEGMYGYSHSSLDSDALCESHERLRAELDAARKQAADYLRLTDPTPLTEQVLREAGFVNMPGFSNRLELGRVLVRCTDPMIWWHEDFQNVEPQPRNVGELNRLLDRVNGGAE